MISLLKKSQTLGIALVALVIFLPACTHRKIVTLGTHTVTVSRHGFEKRLHVNTDAAMPALEYAGMATDGKGLKVSIRGDEITIDGVEGRLKPGDSVLITDDGVLVNSLDYGESARYLQANSRAADSATLN